MMQIQDKAPGVRQHIFDNLSPEIFQGYYKEKESLNRRWKEINFLQLYNWGCQRAEFAPKFAHLKFFPMMQFLLNMSQYVNALNGKNTLKEKITSFQ